MLQEIIGEGSKFIGVFGNFLGDWEFISIDSMGILGV